MRENSRIIFDKTNRPELIYGSRAIKIEFDPIKKEVTTYIESISEKTKMPGETTKLYVEVKRVCQELANKLDIKVTYKFSTALESMKKWAILEDKGKGLFDWDDMYEIESNATQDDIEMGYDTTALVCIKYFLPDTKQL